MLVHIQANLDQDLSLEALANRVRLSQFHFHRLFRSAVGETLKQYTQRGLPAIEVYRTTRVDASHEMNHTEIYLPVSRLNK